MPMALYIFFIQENRLIKYNLPCKKSMINLIIYTLVLPYIYCCLLYYIIWTYKYYDECDDYSIGTLLWIMMVYYIWP